MTLLQRLPSLPVSSIIFCRSFTSFAPSFFRTSISRIAAPLQARFSGGSAARKHLEPKFKQGRGKKLGIEVAKLVAKNRGGECLSEIYISAMEHLWWKCGQGHVWQATLNNVKNLGTWCPGCSGRRSSARNLETKRVAQEKAKPLVKSKKAPQKTALHPEKLSSAKGKQSKRDLSRLNRLEEAREIAASRGGRCLSSVFRGYTETLLWECKEGHTWEARLTNVKYGKTWCPCCCARGGITKASIEDAHRVAASFGGICLSKKLRSATEKLHWRCSKGHEFQGTLLSVEQSKTSCPECRLSDRKVRMLDLARTLAAGMGGSCLSSEYVDNRSELRWRCRQGHEWEASLVSVQAKCWCPQCSMSAGEHQVKTILEQIFFGHVFKKVFPEFLRLEGKRRGLQLDGFCPALNLAFEFNGEQHYNPRCFYNADPRSLDSFEARVRRDRLKLELCEKAGVFLVVVPHFAPDIWLCVRLQLMRWFSMAQIFPAAIGE